MTTTSDHQLDEVTIKQLIWKPSTVTNTAITIVEKVLTPPFTVWPDEIPITDIALADRKTIGISWRLLTTAEIISQTGQYRKSTATGRSGGAIFEYRLENRSRAETFLRRNGRTVIQPGQTEMFGLN